MNDSTQLDEADCFSQCQTADTIRSFFLMCNLNLLLHRKVLLNATQYLYQEDLPCTLVYPSVRDTDGLMLLVVFGLKGQGNISVTVNFLGLTTIIIESHCILD